MNNYYCYYIIVICSVLLIGCSIESKYEKEYFELYAQYLDDYKRVNNVAHFISKYGDNSQNDKESVYYMLNRVLDNRDSISNEITKAFDPNNRDEIFHHLTTRYGEDDQFSSFQKKFVVFFDANVNKGFTNFNFINLSGDTINTKIYEDKTLIIDFWATWCKPCLEMMPYFYEIANKYQNNKDVVFLSIAIRDDYSKWQSKVKDGTNKNVHQGFVYSKEEYLKASKQIDLLRIPKYVIVSKGKIVSSNAPAPKYELFEKWINQI